MRCPQAPHIGLTHVHGSWFSRRVDNDDCILAEGEKIGVFAELLENERGIGRKQCETFRGAHAPGAKLVFGTDDGACPNGICALQFAKMVE